MKAKTIKGKSTEEIQSALEEAMADGFIPTLATVFLSIQMDRNAICEILDKKGIQLFGATTEGEITDSETEKNSASILLLDVNPHYFKIYFEEVSAGGYKEATRSIALNSLKFCNDPAFIFTGSGVWQNPYIEPLLDGFREICGDEVNVFGGMAGDDLTLTTSYIFTNTKSSSHGVLALVFDPNKISVKGALSCGWKPIGTSKIITSSTDNNVYAIDDEPPLALIMRYAGIKKLPDNLFDIQTELNQTLQIQLQRDNGEPIMRVGVVNMEDQSLFFMGSMPEGGNIKFCLLPDLETIDETIDEIKNLKDNEIPKADAVLLFNCIGREMAFGPTIGREIEGIYTIWKSPMAGFFSQGEFGRAKGSALEVHNLTTCCVVLKEK